MLGDDAGKAGDVSEGDALKTQKAESIYRPIDKQLNIECPQYGCVKAEGTCLRVIPTGEIGGEDDMSLHDRPGFFKPVRICNYLDLVHTGQNRFLAGLKCTYPVD